MTETPKQEQDTLPAVKAETRDPGPSPDNRVSSVSEASTEQAGDPDAEDRSEAGIDGAEENEARSPSEHVRSGPVSGFRDATASAEEEEVTDSAGDESVAPSTPDVDPDLGAAIVTRAVHDSIVTRAASPKSSQFVDQIPADPSAEAPPSTQPRHPSRSAWTGGRTR